MSYTTLLFSHVLSVSTGAAKGSWLDPFYRRENKLTEAGDLGAQLLKCKTPSSELSSACLQASISLTLRGAELRAVCRAVRRFKFAVLPDQLPLL